MNYSLGRYTVGNKKFTDKLQAILYSKEVGGDITWDFHDDLFNAFDWTVEPTESLLSLYALRAKQIREEYDYVIVMASGGGDSTNVIYSFLNNGIKIDEIIASAPLSGLSNWDHNEKITNTQNTISETYYAQLPLLREISDKYTNVKITINDYFEEILDYNCDEWLYSSADFIHPTTVARYSLRKIPHIRNLVESGKKIGVVYGIDKPFIAINKDRNYYTVINDRAINVPRDALESQYTNIENVLFYYSPLLPQLMIKQAHIVSKYINLIENFNTKNLVRDLSISSTYIENSIRNSHYQRAIIPAIYPEYKYKFQAMKPISTIGAEHDEWFYKLHNKLDVYSMMKSDIKHFLSYLGDSKYYEKENNSFTTFYKYWLIGSESDFLIKEV